MPRNIKGYEFWSRERDAFEEMKAIKLCVGLYGKDQMKVLFLVNQFGRPYTDIYIKKDAKPIREVNSIFGSCMNFKDKVTGKVTGNNILIRKK